MSDPRIILADDPAALAAQAVDLISEDAAAAVDRRGRFLFVLTGGSTPEKTYQHLPDNLEFPWPKTYLFVGDERVVPWTDPRSNYGMAGRSMIWRLQLRDEQLQPVHTDLPTPNLCALDYETRLRKFFNIPAPKSEMSDLKFPTFDLLLLGLGDDGHIASLFPAYPTLDIADRWVVASPPGTLPPPVDRVTMTYPVINAARHVLLLVAGKNKAAAIRDVLELHLPKEQRPAAGLAPLDGRLTYLLDKDAASLLSRATLEKYSHQERNDL